LNIYLDTSAVVKAYIREQTSTETIKLIRDAKTTATLSITKVEVAAALSRATRVDILTIEDGKLAWERFRSDWNNLARLDLSEAMVEAAANAAWEYGLRGIDSVHLAAALLWQEALDEAATLATFDKRLWNAAKLSGLLVWPLEYK